MPAFDDRLAHLKFTPRILSADNSNVELLALVKQSLAEAGPGQMEAPPVKCVVIPKWTYDLLAERHSLTWPADYFHEVEVREAVREECAKIAEQYGSQNIADAIRASKPNYPAIG